MSPWARGKRFEGAGAQGIPQAHRQIELGEPEDNIGIGCYADSAGQAIPEYPLRYAYNWIGEWISPALAVFHLNRILEHAARKT